MNRERKMNIRRLFIIQLQDTTSSEKAILQFSLYSSQN